MVYAVRLFPQSINYHKSRTPGKVNCSMRALATLNLKAVDFLGIETDLSFVLIEGVSEEVADTWAKAWADNE